MLKKKDVGKEEKKMDRRLNDIDLQNWNDEVNIHVYLSCFNYRIFKQVISLEEYMLKLDFSDRTSLCKYRCGNSKLPCRLAPDRH